MRILIVSDTHKSSRNLEQVIAREQPVDMLIHLGDVEGAEDYIKALVDCPVHMVGGNNDFFSDLPREEEFLAEGRRIFITHGHYYYVSMGEDKLKEAARKRGADIVMYGHTHKPAYCVEQGLVVLNPGSITYPRQMGRQASYMIMDLLENEDPRVEVKYV